MLFAKQMDQAAAEGALQPAVPRSSEIPFRGGLGRTDSSGRPLDEQFQRRNLADSEPTRRPQNNGGPNGPIKNSKGYQRPYKAESEEAAQGRNANPPAQTRMKPGAQQVSRSSGSSANPARPQLGQATRQARTDFETERPAMMRSRGSSDDSRSPIQAWRESTEEEPVPALASQSGPANSGDGSAATDSSTGNGAPDQARHASQALNTSQTQLQPAVVSSAMGLVVSNMQAFDATPMDQNGTLNSVAMQDDEIQGASEESETLLHKSQLLPNSSASLAPARVEIAQTRLWQGDRLGATQTAGDGQGKNMNFDAPLGGALLAKAGIGNSPEAESIETRLERIGRQLSASELNLADQPNQEKGAVAIANDRVPPIASPLSLIRMDTPASSGLQGMQDSASLVAKGAVDSPPAPMLGAAAQFGPADRPASALDAPGQPHATATEANSFGGGSAKGFHLDLQFDPQSLLSQQETIGPLSLAGDPAVQPSPGNSPNSGPKEGQDHRAGQGSQEGSGNTNTAAGFPANDSEVEGSSESVTATSIGGRPLNIRNGGLPTSLSDAERPSQLNEISAGSPIQEQYSHPGPTQAEGPAPWTATGLALQGNEPTRSSPTQLNSNPSTLGTTRPNGEAAPRPLSAAVHQLRIEIPVPGAAGGVDEKIQLHFNQRNAGLNLGIHANNGDLGLELRDALPELIRKLGTGGWQADHGPGASAANGSEALPQDPRIDFGRPLRLPDRNSIFMDDAAASSGENSKHQSMNESSGGKNRGSSETNVSQDLAEADGPRQRSGQQDNFPGRDTQDADAQQRDPRRERRGRQQNWNRAWSGLNLSMPPNS